MPACGSQRLRSVGSLLESLSGAGEHNVRRLALFVEADVR